MPRNKELNEKIKDERREQILLASLELFASKGLSATKITHIAQKSGISQGLLYHYYSSKEEIFTDLVKTAFERLNMACKYLYNLDVPPQKKIRYGMESILENLAVSDSSANYHLLIAHASLSEDIPVEAKAIIQKENQVPYDIIEKILREGQKEGTIKKHDAKDMAVLYWTTVKGLAMHKAVHPRKFVPPDINILMSMFLIDQ